MNTNSFEKIINEAWNNKGQVNSKSSREILNSINKTIDLLDSGKIRVAQKKNNEWVVNEWIKKAILLSFRVNKMKISKGPYAAWFDKVEGKTHKWNEKRFIKEGFRYVPNGVVRKGAYIGKNVVLMPSFINIGAYNFYPMAPKKDKSTYSDITENEIMEHIRFLSPCTSLILLTVGQYLFSFTDLLGKTAWDLEYG